MRVTVQEAGILQSFPADYPWKDTKSQQYRQVGDAVPPLLAMHILRPLRPQNGSASLCGPCREEWLKWLDYQQPVTGIKFANHAAYDDTTAGRGGVRRSGFEQWRDTIRYQQQLIKDDCARNHRQQVAAAEPAEDKASECAA